MSYVAVRTVEHGTCDGRRCGTADAPVTLVYSEARFHHDPNAVDVSAWLCPACLTRLGDRVRPLDVPDRLPVRDPFLYRGEPVAPF